MLMIMSFVHYKRVLCNVAIIVMLDNAYTKK